MAHTQDAIKILRHLTGESSNLQAGIAQAKINFEVAQMIFDGRAQAGLLQAELAALIGSKQPVIARLEDASYEGHLLTTLQEIAAALEQRLDVRFVPRKSPAKSGIACPEHVAEAEGVPISDSVTVCIGFFFRCARLYSFSRLSISVFGTAITALNKTV